MKKLIMTLFVVALILTGCGHGQYYSKCRPEVRDITADAIEAIQLHMDKKMDDDEAQRKLESLSEDLDELGNLNTYEDGVKMYIDFAAMDVGTGETAIDQLHNLEDYQ